MKPRHKRINLITCTKDQIIKAKLIDKFNTSWIQIFDIPDVEEISKLCAYNKFNYALILIDEDQYRQYSHQLDSSMSYMVVTDDTLRITDNTWNVCMIPRTIAQTDYLAEFVHLMMSRRAETAATTAIKNNALKTLEEIKRI